MTEPGIKRIVVACDAQAEIERAISEATALAARWRVPLHGVFLKDENLLRLAGLPFARSLSLSSREHSERFDSGGLETLLSALAAGMRRTLATAAEEAGLDWSFAELRDMPSATAVALEQGDMLVIEAGVRPLSGSWQPRSPWESIAGKLGPKVLLRRSEPTARPRRILGVLHAGSDHAQILDAARGFAGPRDESIILYLGKGDAASDAPLARELAARGLSGRKLQLAKDGAELRRRIARLKPDLIAIGTTALENDELRRLIAETSCDLLLLG